VRLEVIPDKRFQASSTVRIMLLLLLLPLALAAMISVAIVRLAIVLGAVVPVAIVPLSFPVCPMLQHEPSINRKDTLQRCKLA
jgi:hypothetical protein